MNPIKMSEEIWYFEDALENPDELLNYPADWDKTPNHDDMVTARIDTKEYLDVTDDAIFKCLDVWYKNHLHLNPVKYKLAKSTFIHSRGPGPGYGPHTDFMALPDQTYEQVSATILAYLHDPEDFEGGEIFFPDYDVTIRPKKGSILIFGNKVRHGVTDVISGRRAIASVFLVKEKYHYKEMWAVDPNNPTLEELRRFELLVPQYEMKNGNSDVSKFIDDIG